MRKKKCCVCKEIKGYKEFVGDATNGTGVSATCRKCQKEYEKEYLGILISKLRILLIR